MLVNLEFDQNAQAAPQSFRDSIQAAANILDQTFIDPITVNITVGYGELTTTSLGVQTLSNGEAEASVFNGHVYSYGAIRQLLGADLDTSVQSGVSALPLGSTIQGQSRLIVWSAEEKALGLIAGSAAALDAAVGFAAGIPTNLLVGVALHELTHAMGRTPDGGGSSPPDVFDLYRFSSVGARLFGSPNTAPAAYFSLNNGQTHLADYGQASDPGDFLNSSNLTTNDAFNEDYNSRTLQLLTQVDLLQMEALGFHLAPVTATNRPPLSDFNGDGYSDVLFRNPATGDWGYAAMGSGGYAWDHVGNSTAAYAIRAKGDFNGDGVTDVVFQNTSTGDFGYAAMQRNSYTWVHAGNSTPDYSVVGAGDFNGDGIADILFQNQSTGDFGYAAMHPGGYTWVHAGNSSPAYTVAGVGDFNGDGIADILFQNTATGDWGYAAMSPSGYTWVHEGNSGAGYAIAGVGDFNGDGLTDVLFRNPTTGDWGYAAMSPSGYTWSHMGIFPSSYSIVATGDYNRDGLTDVVFRNNSTSDWGYLAMNNHGGAWYDLGAADPAYLIV
jgi:hypothetical protein